MLPGIKAKGLLHGKEVEATAVNPGDWFGKVWLLYVEDCFDPPLYAVEADNVSDAIDVFIESDHGKAERIDIEVEGGDYGFEVNPGDIIGGVNITEKGWMNLKGEFITDPKIGKSLSEPSMSGQGEQYDDDNIKVVGREISGRGREIPWPCVYYGEGVPACGVSPLVFGDKKPCHKCDKEFFPKVDGALEDFCSQACYDEVNGDDEDDDE